METTFRLKNGRVLHLKPVRTPGLRRIITQFGDKALTDPDSITRLTGRAQMQALRATEQLFSYCAGWGVKDDPPDDALGNLEALGCNVDHPRLARADWLRFFEIEDDDEAGDLIAAVMTLTQEMAMEPEAEPEEDTEVLQAQVAELQAKLATIADEKDANAI